MSGRLAGRLIALGITGSIAAYKSVELLRLLQADGADVVTLISHSASRFVAPLTLEALSRHPVESDVLALLPDGRIGHIVIADSVDAVVVAPATAHWLASMAAGLSGDVITATCLATSAPVVVAPAMDGEMYAHPATRANVARLRDDFGYRVVDPERGPLASGQVGVGRLAALPAIVDAVVAAIGARPVRAPSAADRPPVVGSAGVVRDTDLDGRHIVVTAGGTAEPIDPVRFIGNRSTGKMGVAIAEAALARGARVTLIVGLTSVALPADATVVRAESTGAMRAAVLSTLAIDAGDASSAGTAASGVSVPWDSSAPVGPVAGLDALIMAAAVADFRPVTTAATKLVRGDGMTLDLEPTPDILAEVGRIARGLDATGAPTREPLAPRPILVGFAAETGSLARATDKIRKKGVDLLVANDVAEAGSGFGTDTNRVTIYTPDADPEPWPLLDKREVADRLLDRVAAALDGRDTSRQTGRNAPAEPRTAVRTVQEIPT